jgi:hypothetical protein
MNEQERSRRIAELNDAFHKVNGGPGRVFLTEGIAEMDEWDRASIFKRVQHYCALSFGTDSEHDCGKFEYGEETIFWRIAYFDRAMKGVSPDPADVRVTVRVLLLLRDDEQ